MRTQKQLGALRILLVAAIGALAHPGCRKAPPSSSGSSEPRPGVTVAPRTTDAQPAPAAADPVHGVIDELLKKYEGLDAVTVNAELRLAEAAGLKGKTHGKGVFDMKRVDGKSLTRFAMNNHLYFDIATPDEPGKEMFTVELLWQVYDGEHLWLLFKQVKLSQVIKAHYDPGRVLHVGGRELFRSVREDSEVKLLPDEEVDGRPAYVLESKPKGGDWTARHWFDKATGVRLKAIETDASGAETFNLTLTGLNLKPDFAPGHFEFKQSLEGYEFIDETASAAGEKTGGGAGSAEGD